MMGVLYRLLSNCAISQSGIGRLTYLILLEVMNLLVLRVVRSHNVLFPVPHAIRDVVAAGPRLDNAALLSIAIALVGSVN